VRCLSARRSSSPSICRQMFVAFSGSGYKVQDNPEGEPQVAVSLASRHTAQAHSEPAQLQHYITLDDDSLRALHLEELDDSLRLMDDFDRMIDYLDMGRQTSSSHDLDSTQDSESPQVIESTQNPYNPGPHRRWYEDLQTYMDMQFDELDEDFDEDDWFENLDKMDQTMQVMKSWLERLPTHDYTIELKASITDLLHDFVMVTTALEDYRYDRSISMMARHCPFDQLPSAKNIQNLITKYQQLALITKPFLTETRVHASLNPGAQPDDDMKPKTKNVMKSFKGQDLPDQPNPSGKLSRKRKVASKPKKTAKAKR
jgi:hypothetical protein